MKFILSMVFLGLAVWFYAPQTIFDSQLPLLFITVFACAGVWFASSAPPLSRFYGGLCLALAAYLVAVHLAPIASPVGGNPIFAGLGVMVLLFGAEVGRRGGFKGRYLPQITLSVVTILLLLALGEILVRHDWVRRNYLGGYPITTLPEYTTPRQHLGAADTPFPLQKSPDTLRVLLLGDSFTYGFAVMPEQGFAAYLQADFPTAEIIVLAEPASNTLHELQLWRDYGVVLVPDVVIVGVVINDVELGQLVPEPPLGILRYGFPRSQLAYFLETRAQQISIRDWEKNLYQGDLTIWEQSVRLLADEIHAIGALAWAFILIRPDDFGDDFYRQSYAYLAETFRQGGFVTVNLWEAYQAQFQTRSYKSLCAFPNDCHPNPELHRFYADVIGANLRDEFDLK